MHSPDAVQYQGDQTEAVPRAIKAAGINDPGVRCALPSSSTALTTAVTRCVTFQSRVGVGGN
jgi:hypothetical protein